MELFAIALRNVFRNPRRTLLNLVAIGLGVMIILTMKGWIAGFSLSAYQTTIDLDTADVQILQKDYQAEARRLPLDLRITDWPGVKAALKDVPGLKAVGARIDVSAELGNGVTTVGVTLRAVDPDGEAQTNSIRPVIHEGTYFTADDHVLVGSGLARKLGLQLGDHVFLTALDQYGVKNLVDGSVGGIFTSGYGLFDDTVVYMPLKKAQEALALAPGDATRVVVKFQHPGNLDQEVAAVRQALASHGLATAPLAVYPWTEFARSLVDTLESRVRILTMLMGVLVLLVAVGILNSMSMAVQERYQEIGTLRAIGMNRRQLTRLFLLEGFSLGLAGGVAGLLGAAVLAWWGLTWGVDARNFLPRDLPIPLVSVLRPAYSPGDFPLAALLSGAVAVVGSLAPARRAGKMVVRDALGSHV